MPSSPPSLPLPPGTLGLPVVGESLAFVADPFAFFEERFRRHGPVYKTRLFGDDVIVFVGPEGFTFFNDDARFTRRSASPPHIQELFHRDAVPFLDGADQRKRRTLLLQPFTPEAIAGYAPTVERVTNRFLDRWLSGVEVRGNDEFGAMCFAIADALFVGADPGRDDARRAQTFQRFLAGLFAVPVNLPFTTYGKALRARDELRAYIARAVEEYRPGSAAHVLERLCAARTEDGQALTREEVRIETLHFFGASYAGLQAGLVNVTRALAQNPAVADRARAEVRSLAPAGALAETVQRLPYVSQVTREVRRYYKIAPSTFFAVVRGDCEFGGFRVPGGWKAVAVPHSTMRDEKTFAEPDRFDPDRFAPDRLEKLPRNAYVPHGGGPMTGHRCAGEALANLVLDGVTALLLRRATWELTPGQDLTDRMAGLSPLPKDGLRVRFRAASG